MLISPPPRVKRRLLLTPRETSTADGFSSKTVRSSSSYCLHHIFLIVIVFLGGDFAGRPETAIDPSIASAATPSSSSAAGTTGLSKFSQKVLKRQKQPPAPTLFMGNLGFEATADSIRAMIEAHEKVRDDKAKARKKNAEKEKGKKKNDEMDIEDGKSEGEGDNDEEERKEVSLVKVRVGTFEDSGKCKGYVSLWFVFSCFPCSL